MAITGITDVSVDRDEYSQYEESRRTITATITGTPAQPANNDSLIIQLKKARRNRDVVVAEQTYVFDGITSTFATTGIDVSFNVHEILDVDQIRLMHRGDYFIHVENALDENINKDSNDFKVVLMTIEKFKQAYLFGLDLQSAEVRKWKLPPNEITGVKLLEVSRAHPTALFPLNFTNNNGTIYLNWAEGPIVKIDANKRSRYLLPAKNVQEYIIVEVNPKFIPSTPNIQEYLFVEEDTMSDEDLREFIDQAVSLIEDTDLQVYLEPTRIVTDIDPTSIVVSNQDMSPIILEADWDVLGDPISHYPRNPGEWIHMQFPYFHIRRFDSLFGAIANTRVIDINLEWIEIGRKGGFVQLVPFNQEIAFAYLGLVWVESMRSTVALPNFWHYNLLAGLPDLPAGLLEFIGRKAAIPVLTVAGHAYRSGYAAQSISRDGVSESVSYTASAIYGIYSATIEDNRRWIKEHLPRFRSKYRGLNLWVV